MTSDLSTTSTSSVPVLPVIAAGAAAQLVGVVAAVIVPPLGLISGILAILLTAGAARVVTRDRRGVALARTGLAVGGASALLGLIIGGFGLVAILLAGVTVVAGVVGAVAARPRSS